ncbi:DUF1285 domain-containing protein [Shewanella sp. HN-41]|uniref:DUF1285 domain-containing protein n=1 Tax=Shewanella sp. HN-41 TaxID=327275 RepID=UPI000212629F|nr:DUF1285 domain-containing protein [Shewanella sp. HN-41]EGM69761.1 hypothetical protein SOHN41_02243 [Shewanella sp. HN-41]
MDKLTNSKQQTLEQLALNIVSPTSSMLSEGIPLCREVALFNIQVTGDWLYQGTALPMKFAKLFAGILHCIEDEHFLITPVEKVRVTVVDVPLVIVDFERGTDPAYLQVKTSIDTEHQILDINRMKLTDFGIYLPLERGLWGKLSRACYYNFVNEFNLSDLE